MTLVCNGVHWVIVICLWQRRAIVYPLVARLSEGESNGAQTMRTVVGSDRIHAV